MDFWRKKQLQNMVFSSLILQCKKLGPIGPIFPATIRSLGPELGPEFQVPGFWSHCFTLLEKNWEYFSHDKESVKTPPSSVPILLGQKDPGLQDADGREFRLLFFKTEVKDELLSIRENSELLVFKPRILHHCYFWLSHESALYFVTRRMTSIWETLDRDPRFLRFVPGVALWLFVQSLGIILTFLWPDSLCKGQ